MLNTHSPLWLYCTYPLLTNCTKRYKEWILMFFSHYSKEFDCKEPPKSIYHRLCKFVSFYSRYITHLCYSYLIRKTSFQHKSWNLCRYADIYIIYLLQKELWYFIKPLWRYDCFCKITAFQGPNKVNIPVFGDFHTFFFTQIW